MLTGAAGLVTSARSSLAFILAYDLETGESRDGYRGSFSQQGGHFLKSSMAHAVQFPNGVDVVVLFNSAGPYEMDPVDARELVTDIRGEIVDEIGAIDDRVWEQTSEER